MYMYMSCPLLRFIFEIDIHSKIKGCSENLCFFFKDLITNMDTGNGLFIRMVDDDDTRHQG